MAWICQYCKEEFSFIKSGEKANHSRWCFKNPKRSEYVNKLKESIEERTKKAVATKKQTGITNQFTKAEKLGLPKPKASTKSTFLGKHHTEATKEKIRQAQLKAILNGKIIKNGRAKHYKHISPIAGEISVQGTWELRFAQWADKKDIKYERNKEGFGYIKPNGKQALYYPDFKLNSTTYIEVKGYETVLDRTKWEQFPYTLIVLGKDFFTKSNLTEKDLRNYVRR